jgi:acetyl esterase/lipase
MRNVSIFALLAAVLFALPHGADAAEPKAIIEKAIKAHGGQERLAKIKAIRTKAKGKVNLGVDVPFTWDITWQAKRGFNLAAELEAAGTKVALVQGVDATGAWGSANGAVAPLTGKKLEEFQAQIHLRRVLTLHPLLEDKSFKLANAGEVKVDDRPADGVKVSAEGERDLTLYFDRETARLARLDRLVLDDGKMQEVPQDDYFHDYKDVDGVQTAMREVWMRAGKKVAELVYSEVSYPEKIEDREFARPAAGLPAELPVERTADVIYGKKIGVALTMDVFQPKEKANGAAVIFVVSGGWVSDNQALNNVMVSHFVVQPVKRGYTVFAVYHGSQPKFTIPEVVSDINRAVRFIRHHADDYGIDPNRIGITGGSAGGHLSLMLGTAGDKGNAKAADPVDQESSRVQAVACLFPPTDFLNYGGAGRYAFGQGELLQGFRTAVDVRDLDPKTNRLERTTDEKKQKELAAQISPITHASADDPPTLIVHGDADTLVPIQQAELLVEKLKQQGVTAELLTRPKRGHDFNGVDKDVAAMVDWFDKHLGKK